MMDILYLDGSVGAGVHFKPLASVLEPTWEEVSEMVRFVFDKGGDVKLRVATPVSDQRLSFGVFLAMDSHPGECILTYFEESGPGERIKNRIWWEEGGAPFRGKTEFNDHYFDDRRVCRDVDVALNLFDDFFKSFGFSDVGLALTKDAWGDFSER